MPQLNDSEPIVEEGEGMIREKGTEEELEEELKGKIKFYTLTLAYDPTSGEIAGASAYHGEVLKEAGAPTIKAMECQAIATAVTKATQQAIFQVGHAMEVVEALKEALTGGDETSDNQS